MTIKHPISKIQWAIVWALNYYLTQLSSWCQRSCQQTSKQLETRCGREGHTRPRGTSESPDGVDPNIKRTRKTQRDCHNSGVKIWSLWSVTSALSHANLEQPFRTLAINWEVNMLLKKSSCVFILPASSFLRRLFMRLSLMLCRCDAEWWCIWLYNSNTEENHVKHFSQLFERLSTYHVLINADKCVFSQNSLAFWGHLIDSNGIQPLSTKVEAIQQISPPTSLRQLRQFLGMVNFYKRFIPNCANKLLLLTALLNTQKKKKVQIVLTEYALSSFELVKKELS